VERGTKERQRRRQAEADALYNRLYPLLKGLGPLQETPQGEGRPGVRADICRVAVMLGPQPEGRVLTPDLLHSSLHRVLRKGWVYPFYQDVWNNLASELETAGPDYVNHFLTLVRRARGLPESIVVTKPRLTKKDEWPFEVWQLEVDALIVDHDYQRPVSWPFVRRIAQS